jgi:hypothetical protein
VVDMVRQAHSQDWLCRVVARTLLSARLSAGIAVPFATTRLLARASCLWGFGA